MLKLQRLEVSGFKSFVDPVKLEFAGGITSVVGPNGCGKSNISDAVTWVLGEQSAKSLRGGKMEDVIFNGSERRKPLGMAEATLTLATDPSFAAAEDGKITLSRRVFRTGESEYRMNGKKVRLKDIKDLLMDTGLGIRAYSVIEQGRIGMILSGKPQERRRLLEEAAGITRYKTRKRIAEMKLEETTGNLLRLDDIVSEVERALRSLKRQAGAARRFHERKAEYRELLEQVLVGRWSRLDGRLRKVSDQLAALITREAELTQELSSGEAGLAQGRETLERLSTALAERHERQAALGARIEGRQDFLKASRSSLQEMGERIAASHKLAAQREEENRGHAQALEALSSRRQEIVLEVEQAETDVGQDEERLVEAEKRLAGAATRVEEHRAKLLAAANDINQLKSQLQREQIELEKGNYRRNHLSDEIDRHNQQLKQAQDELEIARSAVNALKNRLAEREMERDQHAAALEETLRLEAEATEARRSTYDDLVTAKQRREVLSELAKAHAEKRAVLEEALEAAGYSDPTFLSDRLRAVAGWERGLDFYLGQLTDAVLLPEGHDSLELAGSLAGGRSRASLLRPVDGPAATWPTVDDPAVSLSLAEALNLPPELAQALPPAYLVNQAADAERLARSHPGIAFLSHDRVWAQGGVVHVEGDEARPGILEIERELAELAANIPSLEDRLTAQTAEVERLVELRAEQAGQVHRVEGEITQTQKELAVAQAKLQTADERHQRLATLSTTLSEERDELEALITQVSGRREQALVEVKESESRHDRLQQAFDRTQEEVDAVKGEREDLRASTTGNRGRLELLRERLASHDREADRLGKEIEDGTRQISLWKDEAARLQSRRGELEASIEQSAGELQLFLEQQSRSQDEVLEAQKKLDDHRDILSQAESGLTERRGLHDQVRREIEELRVQQAALQGEGEHLQGAFREEFERDLPTSPPEAPAELAELEADLARRKAALERMGPVNALAVEEYAEQEERHGFLTQQRADVVESIESLRKTIKEINETSSERFVETFEAVNATFGEVFARLFRGGEAEMRLLDEDDVLESGIEIVARPPGKRLQNIMLMSGGEKALTAIALLFALFRAKPSPFCILDEVDAPLDDANAVRFAELLQELADETQFIVITHNKITMELAHTLYGVTMEERGVSKVVAVTMDEVQPEEQAVSA